MTKRGFNCQRDVICGNSHDFSKAIEEPISFRVLGQALIRMECKTNTKNKKDKSKSSVKTGLLDSLERWKPILVLEKLKVIINL
ncbi:hypothetical protein [Leptospira santarosai]|uniref:hypothetical protein n=1 Tax=Leptospira santarosai TaxID=28183 RepID=UPI001E3D2F1C|nr:hypothetical protein [Leptospira santarosai]